MAESELVFHIAARMKPGLFSHSPIVCHCLQWLSSSVHADADAPRTCAGAQWSSSRHAKRARLSLGTIVPGPVYRHHASSWRLIKRRSQVRCLHLVPEGSRLAPSWRLWQANEPSNAAVPHGGGASSDVEPRCAGAARGGACRAARLEGALHRAAQVAAAQQEDHREVDRRVPMSKVATWYSRTKRLVDRSSGQPEA